MPRSLEGALRASDGLPLDAARSCNVCKETRTVGDFYRHSGYVDRRCKVCYRVWNRPWGEKNPEKKKRIRRESARKRYAEDPLAFRRRALKTKYGITLEDYDRMLAEQNRVCAVCRKPETAKWKGKTKPLAVDHCHQTKRVRGLLCTNCNQGIGLGRDDPYLLMKLAAYLTSTSELPGRSRPSNRTKLDWLGGSVKPISGKECQCHNYRYREYGITMAKFHGLIESQGNKCAVCKRPETAVESRGGKTKELAVDHNHDTGAIRGLLCWRCNAVIGRMSESSITLEAAASYLGIEFGLGDLGLVEKD